MQNQLLIQFLSSGLFSLALIGAVAAIVFLSELRQKRKPPTQRLEVPTALLAPSTPSTPKERIINIWTPIRMDTQNATEIIVDNLPTVDTGIFVSHPQVEEQPTNHNCSNGFCTFGSHDSTSHSDFSGFDPVD